MKKIALIVLAVGISFTLLAQNDIYKTSIDTISQQGKHDVGWLRAHILDNWEIDLNCGGQLYYGYEDMKGPIYDRLSFLSEVHAARWIFPMVGLRAGIGFGTERGFITTESYLANRNTITDLGSYGSSHGTTESTTVIGNDTIHGAFGGYYWPYKRSDDLLIQKWKYADVTADIILNLSYLKPYNKVNFKTPWSYIAYIGFQIRLGLSEKHPQVPSAVNHASEGHIGFIARYKINEHLNLHGDLRMSMVEGLFDRERIPNVEILPQDLNLSFMVGMSYDFNLRSETKRLKYYVEKGILPYNAQKVPKNVVYMQLEDVSLIQIIDTLMVYHVDTIDDLVIINRVDSLKTTLDSIIHVARTIPKDTPLDTIFYKQLLPYEMVFFERDKWDIRYTEEMKIAKMAKIMKAFPDQKFYLYGSADAKTGTVKRNDFLSHTRADVVYNRLIIDYGINPDQMVREYLGGINDYDPFILNRTVVIIMDHEAVRKAFNDMKIKRKAGSGMAEF